MTEETFDAVQANAVATEYLSTAEHNKELDDLCTEYIQNAQKFVQDHCKKGMFFVSFGICWSLMPMQLRSSATAFQELIARVAARLRMDGYVVAVELRQTEKGSPRAVIHLSWF